MDSGELIREFVPLIRFTMLRLFTLLFVLFSCKSAGTEPLSIQPLSQFNRTYETEANGYIHCSKIEFYLVDGFQNTAEQEAKIDSFVCANLSSDYADFDTYRIYFYMKSRKTNFEAIAADPRKWERAYEANDRVYDYHWMSGKLLSVTYWSNGIQIEYRNKLLCSPSGD